MASLKYEANSTFQTGTLGSGYTSGGGSLALTSGHGSRFPSAGDFWVRVDSEIFKCTARTGDTLTVTGAQDGTSAANHSSGAAVRWVMGVAALGQLRADAILTGTYANLPATCSVGQQYFPTDSVFTFVCHTTNVWTAYLFGIPWTVPPSTGYSWGNQGTSTLSTTAGFWRFVPESGTGWNLRRYMRDAMPSAPYRFYVAFTVTASKTVRAGIVLHDGTKSTTWDVYLATDTNSQISSTDMNTDTSANGQNIANVQQLVSGIGGLIWLAIRDDGTNRHFEISRNGGLSWTIQFTETNTNFLTPTSLGVFINTDVELAAEFNIYKIGVE